MANFLMLGKYSVDAIKGISPSRSAKALAIIKKCGGEVKSMHALVGRYDLAFIIDFPKVQDLIKASVALTKLTGVAFVSSPAITIEEFDKVAK
ncbi:MAG: GYD domain-containing protein [Candidatus Omnitrophica bacterium]|nr:GYD domain-containing protein [Candidatus Omnitrophota bacterium]